MLALDLFCGAGGAAMGMWRGGMFSTIVGVDHEPQPDYPFDFVQADVCEMPDLRLDGWLDSESPELDFEPDFVWASPPCQAFSAMAHLEIARGQSTREEWLSRHPDMVEPTRQLLAGHPWTCIENVVGAPIRPDIMLEGGNVGIPGMKRRRWFEVSWDTLSPKPYTMGRATLQGYGCGGGNRAASEYRKSVGLPSHTPVSELRDAFDVDWTSDRRALNNMVPPAYATYVIEDAVRAGFGSVSRAA